MLLCLEYAANTQLYKHILNDLLESPVTSVVRDETVQLDMDKEVEIVQL